MLCRVVAGDSTLGESTRECLWIGGVEEAGDVEGRRGGGRGLVLTNLGGRNGGARR